MQAKNMAVENNFSKRLTESLGGNTQTAISKRLKCSQAVISAYMSGDIPKSFEILKKLAKEYNIDLHWLITGENSIATEGLIRGLKPHILTLLSSVTQRAQLLIEEEFALLSIMPRNEKQEVRLNEIRQEVLSLHRYYNTVVDNLNELLFPFGEKISDALPPTWRKPGKPQE